MENLPCCPSVLLGLRLPDDESEKHTENGIHTPVCSQPRYRAGSQINGQVSLLFNNIKPYAHAVLQNHKWLMLHSEPELHSWLHIYVHMPKNRECDGICEMKHSDVPEAVPVIHTIPFTLLQVLIFQTVISTDYSELSNEKCIWSQGSHFLVTTRLCFLE